MNFNRAGELGKLPVRTDRFFTVDREWYFSTREGCPVGPYNDKNQAGRGLNDFLEFLSLAKPRMLSEFYSSLAKHSAY